MKLDSCLQHLYLPFLQLLPHLFFPPFLLFQDVTFPLVVFHTFLCFSLGEKSET